MFMSISEIVCSCVLVNVLRAFTENIISFVSVNPERTFKNQAWMDWQCG